MKKRIITISLVGLFLVALTSCNASKGHGGHCPAYGN
jgi:predicted small secreted protein